MSTAKFLDPEEKVIWRGRPAKTTVVLQSLAGIPFALIFGIIALVILNFGVPLLGLPLLLLVVAFGLVVVPPIWLLRKLSNTEYIVTNRRLLIRTGITESDLWFSELHRIKDIIIKTGVSDKIFGTAKLYPVTAEYPYAPKLRAYTRGGMSRLKKVYNITTGVYDEVSEMELYRKSISHPHLEGIKEPHTMERLLRETMRARRESEDGKTV